MISRRQFLKAGLISTGAMALSHPAFSNAASSRYGITGRTAPELNIDYWIDRNGDPTTFRLAQHPGKWVFLKCFQSWCPGCHSHGFPSLVKISEALIDNPNIVFASIQTVFEGHSINTRDKIRKTQLQYDLQIPMGHDAGEDGGSPATMVDYRTGGTPWMILINPERQVVYNDFSIDADKAIEFLLRQTTLKS